MSINFWYEKNVLITGHTGFKGWWLTHLLSANGAKIHGLSKTGDLSEARPAQELSLLLSQEAEINLVDYEKLREFVLDTKPEYIFHLAANAIVKDSLANPYEYFFENSTGTLNLVELFRKEKELSRSKMIVSTTDKVYKNNEDSFEYLETDSLWGDDPYSSSKVCVEQIIHSYVKSFNLNHQIRIGRAGNVLGGGDRGNHRLVPYVIQNALENKEIKIRFPDAVRPWQHVMDVVYAYLSIAQWGFDYPYSAYNIAPNNSQNISVLNLVNKLYELLAFTFQPKIVIEQNLNQLEKKYLNLDSNLIKNNLQSENKIDLDRNIQLTVDWERARNEGASPSKITMQQIEWYINGLFSK